MPAHQQYWSDSDDELANSGLETNVLLGLPDGPVDDPADIVDAAVSRIGGLPAFLPSREPPFHSSFCKNCNQPMQLLIQIWCPFENSPMDRALYVWGCSRGSCQKKHGSIRAWRGLRFNEKYAAKLEKKLARQQERERIKAEAAAAEAAKQAAPKSNPFAISASASSQANPFALGNQIFGNVPAPPAPVQTQVDEKEDEENEENDVQSDAKSDTSEQSLLVALASTSLEDSPWKTAPAYQPLYVTTSVEYIPPSMVPKTPANVPQVKESDNEKDIWSKETYENSDIIDPVFDRFTRRLNCDSEQCLRYELDGVPLPFSRDSIYEKMFNTPDQHITIVTKEAFKVTPAAKRTYKPPTDLVAPCSVCKSRRIFECQLMPNIINILRKQVQTGEGEEKMTDEERREAVKAALKNGDGMSFGTCMIFSCEKDCCLEGDNGKVKAKDCWREEVVVVQWDD